MKKNITIRKSQSVDSFLQDASKHPLLTIEEEVMLAKRVQQGDEDAYDQHRAHGVLPNGSKRRTT